MLWINYLIGEMFIVYFEYMISICAILGVRNESRYLSILLPLLAKQGIDVAILDHESTDGSRDLYSQYKGAPIISVNSLKYKGVYSQVEQLRAKKDILSKINHDWVVHHDADEILENVRSGHNLRDAIQEAHESGFNVMNFEEFVFLPKPEENFLGRDYYQEILQYYFFEPGKNRLNRAWRRDLPLDNILSGGHTLYGEDISLFPVNQILRHYIVLGNEHAQHKYVDRRFADEELSRGWHFNRVNLTSEDLILPKKSKYLFNLPDYNSRDFQKHMPSQTHYWAWQEK